MVSLIPFQKDQLQRIRAQKILQPRSAFSLIELLIVVIILGVLASIALVGYRSAVQRSRANAVAFEIVSFVLKIRNEASNEVNSSQDSGGCVIDFTTQASLSEGDQIASSDCADFESSIDVPSIGFSQIQLRSTDGSNVASSQLIMTPRGIWVHGNGSGSTDNSKSGDLIVKVLLEPDGPLRCVRISEYLGSIDVGKANTSSIDATCSDGDYSEV